MKPLERYILMTFMAICPISCTMDYLEDSTFDPLEPELSFDGQNTVKIGKSGGEFSFSFRSNLPWIIECPVDWIHLDGSDRGSGSEEPVNVHCTVDVNKSLTPRSSYITVRIDSDNLVKMTVSQDPMSIEDLGNDIYVKVGGTGDGSSWASATTLSAALADAMDGDKIHVAAGTYIPDTPVRNGDPADPAANTFELMANATLIGGYPADASEGAVADPSVNKVILSGNGSAYKVLVISAPKDATGTFKAVIDGITVTGSNGAGSAVLEINGAKVNAGYGGGIVVAGSECIIRNCKVTQNKSKSSPGLFNCDGAYTTVENCDFDGNQSSGNGANIWNSYATVVIKDCVLQNNTANGVGGALYSLGTSGVSSIPTVTYVYNTFFCKNATDGSSASRRGGGVYSREGSKTLLANCTFTQNFGANGAAISLYGTSAKPAEMTVVNCTVTGNSSSFNGIVEQCANTTMKIYNTIVSGNTADGGTSDVIVSDGYTPTGKLPEVFSYSISGATVYDAEGKPVSGQTFDASSMFSALSDGVFALSGENNPAFTFGMPVAELADLKSGLEDEEPSYFTIDQKGNKREAEVMGAFVGE